MSKITNDGLIRSGTGFFINSCIHMATVGVKELNSVTSVQCYCLMLYFERDKCSLVWLSTNARCDAAAVVDLHVTSCPSTDGVVIATDSAPGYVSNTLYDAYSSLGWYSCPWLIRARPGQRIQLSLLILQASTSTSFRFFYFDYIF